MTERVKLLVAVVFLLTLGAGISGFAAHAAESAPPLTKKQVQELIKTAKTPEEHTKLAQYYRYESDKFKSEAQEHKEMSAEYIHHTVPKFPTMSQHCNDVSDYLTRAARKADELAEMHEQMAKNARESK